MGKYIVELYICSQLSLLPLSFIFSTMKLSNDISQ